MGAEEYLVHTLHCRTIRKDTLNVWRAVTPGDLPSVQIDQKDGVSASVYYAAEDAAALAAAILTAAGIDADIIVKEARP